MPTIETSQSEITASRGLLAPASNNNKAVCYHHFDYCDYETLRLSSAFDSMTRQLLEDVEIPEEMERSIERQCGFGKSRLHGEAVELFLEASEKKDLVLVVLDGLDELNHIDQGQLICTLKNLLSQRKCKIYLSCRREELNFRNAFRGCRGVDIFDHKVSKDLATFINGAVKARTESGIETERLILADPNLESEIIDVLCKKADDMYVFILHMVFYDGPSLASREKFV